MQLIDIDKARYRKHLNIVIVVCIIFFAAGSLAISQTMISLFPDASGSHFHWNVTGVVVTGLILLFLLNKYRGHPFMTEVTYVWELKHSLNLVTRKMTKVKAAAQTGNVKAMLALQHSYSGSRLLWTLDDNTILMDQLAQDQAALDTLKQQYNVELDLADYDSKDLKQF